MAREQRFSITVHDDMGDISLEVTDHKTMTRLEITSDELKPYAAMKGANLLCIAKLLIDIAKPKYREILAVKESDNPELIKQKQ